MAIPSITNLQELEEYFEREDLPLSVTTGRMPKPADEDEDKITISFDKSPKEKVQQILTRRKYKLDENDNPLPVDEGIAVALEDYAIIEDYAEDPNSFGLDEYTETH